MVYTSYIFILAFLPITLIGYFGLSRIHDPLPQKLWLVGASLVFYGYYNAWYLAIIVVSILANYILANLIRKKGGFFLGFGIAFNVGLLGYFKYYDFFVSNINSLFGTNLVLREILLPLGISFFTFQQLSFLISVHKKEEALGSFLDYCMFVTFFPQLVAGPIVLYKEMIPQFQEEKRRRLCIDQFCLGVFLFSLGAFKKAVIADTVALFVENGFAQEKLGFAAAWASALSYTLQIYFDFSGYSDMAIGLGKMFNIDLPANFDSPYKSQSISEFWRRWHITLGRALSTYVYIPLGGNRAGKVRVCFNLFATFLVSGLWHGAAWTFVAWGALNGLFVVLERLGKPLLEKIPGAIRTAITFLIVNFLWVLFRAESFGQAMNVYRGMLCFGRLDARQLSEIAFDSMVNFPTGVDIAYVLTLLLVLLLVVFSRKNSIQLEREFSATGKNAVIAGACLLLTLICISRGSVFIYFNF